MKRISVERLRQELDKRRIVLVAGFQGVNKYDDITTWAGAARHHRRRYFAALNADKCQIYTDVEGIYTADPRKVKGARKLEEITYDEMLELASLGAQVLHNRSVEMAKRYGGFGGALQLRQSPGYKSQGGRKTSGGNEDKRHCQG